MGEEKTMHPGLYPSLQQRLIISIQEYQAGVHYVRFELNTVGSKGNVFNRGFLVGLRVRVFHENLGEVERLGIIFRVPLPKPHFRFSISSPRIISSAERFIQLLIVLVD